MQLITIIDTQHDSKFVLHKYPPKYPSQIPPNTDPYTFLKSAYSYFGLFHPNQLISTNYDHIQQKAFVQMFSANQKFTSMVVGIDDNCVVVARSAFIDHAGKDKHSNLMFSYSSALANFTPITNFSNTCINSISICICLDSYQDIQKFKHLVSYIINALQHKQNNTRYLTQQVTQILKQKIIFQNIVKQIYNQHIKQHPNQQFKNKDLIAKINKQADVFHQKIDLFKILTKFYESINEKKDFLIEDGLYWQSAIGYKFDIPKIQHSKKQAQRLKNKTIITHPKKLQDAIPQVMYTQRIKSLYQNAIKLNNMALKNNLSNSSQLSQQSAYHTLNFLIQNNLAVQIYPFQNPKFYNLYAVNYIPSKSNLQKFNTRIFPNSDLVQICSKFSQYGLAGQTRQIKYLILIGVLKQVKIYIYKLQNNLENSKIKNTTQKQLGGTCKKKKSLQEQQIDIDVNQAVIQSMLEKYRLGEQDLNQLVSKASGQSIQLRQILRYIRKNKTKWGFFFVQT